MFWRSNYHSAQEFNRAPAVMFYFNPHRKLRMKVSSFSGRPARIQLKFWLSRAMTSAEWTKIGTTTISWVERRQLRMFLSMFSETRVPSGGNTTLEARCRCIIQSSSATIRRACSVRQSATQRCRAWTYPCPEGTSEEWVAMKITKLFVMIFIVKNRIKYTNTL